MLTQLVKREQVVTEYTPIEKALMDTFLPLSKFKHPGQAHLKEKMIRGAFNSLIFSLERTLRGPLKSANPDALPLEGQTEEAKTNWTTHMQSMKTPDQARNDARTSSLKRSVDFCEARYKAAQDLQNGLKTVYFQLYGEPWIATGGQRPSDALEYDCGDAVDEFFKKVPEVKTAIVHGISGGARVQKASARRR